LCNGELAVVIPIHGPDRFIVIAFNDEPPLASNGKKPQHVATGDRRHKRFLRVYTERVGKRRCHGMGRCRCWDLGSAVELPKMGSAVAVIREHDGPPLPRDSGQVFGHNSYFFTRVMTVTTPTVPDTVLLSVI
jgi:hypothetical protein